MKKLGTIILCVALSLSTAGLVACSSPNNSTISVGIIDEPAAENTADPHKIENKSGLVTAIDDLKEEKNTAQNHVLTIEEKNTSKVIHSYDNALLTDTTTGIQYMLLANFASNSSGDITIQPSVNSDNIPITDIAEPVQETIEAAIAEDDFFYIVENVESRNFRANIVIDKNTGIEYIVVTNRGIAGIDIVPRYSVDGTVMKIEL